MGTTAQEASTTMQHAEYKLAGDVPEAIKGRIIKTKDCGRNLELMHQLVVDGKSENVAALAQAQYDIIVQRKIREAATSDEVQGILAGKVVEVDDEKLDFSGMTEQERADYAVGRLQAVADDWKHGARPLISGGGTKAAKEALSSVTAIKTAAASNEEVAKKLAELEALGYKL